MTVSTMTAHRKTFLALLCLALLGGSAQVNALKVQETSIPMEASASAGRTTSASADHLVLAFARSVRAGPPQRTLLSGERKAVVEVLIGAKFTALDGNYGPAADAEGFYSEEMNCTVLLSRSGPMWLTAQKGQPSSDLHYEAVLVDHN